MGFCRKSDHLNDFCERPATYLRGEKFENLEIGGHLF